MKALVKVKKGPGGIELIQMPKPLLLPGEILIKVHAVGICGTDLHILKDEFETSPPVIMGHEYSGIVKEVGSEVKNFKVGDRVVSLTTVHSCGECYYCLNGLHMLCETRQAIGCDVNGAFAEYVTIPANKAFIIPNEISLDEATLCEPLACVVRSVLEKSSIITGDYVYISGPGTIGLLALQIALASGGIVVVSGIRKDSERLAIALQLGASAIIIADEEDPLEIGKKFTNGKGFDVAIECAGVTQSAQLCLTVLKKTGRYIQIALFGSKILFDHDLALKKEISITNGFTSTITSWERALQLLKNRKVITKPLITTRLPIEKWEDGFAMTIDKCGCKILLVLDI